MKLSGRVHIRPAQARPSFRAIRRTGTQSRYSDNTRKITIKAVSMPLMLKSIIRALTANSPIIKKVAYGGMAVARAIRCSITADRARKLHPITLKSQRTSESDLLAVTKLRAAGTNVPRGEVNEWTL